MASLALLGRATPTAELVAELNRNGVVAVRDFVDPATLGVLNRELGPHFEAEPRGRCAAPQPTRPPLPGRTLAERFPPLCRDIAHLEGLLVDYYGRETKRFCGLATLSPAAFAGFMCDERLDGIVRHFLLPNCNEALVNTGQAMGVCPGSESQMLHRDEINWALNGGLDNARLRSPAGALPAAGGEITLTVVLALSDFRSETGCTRVVRGSHCWPKDREAPGQGSELVELAVMPAGSAVIYLGQTL